MKAYRWSRSTAPLILNPVIRWRWVVNFTPRLIYPHQRNPVPFKHKGGCTPEADWALEKRKISSPIELQGPECSVRSLVITPIQGPDCSVRSLVITSIQGPDCSVRSLVITPIIFFNNVNWVNIVMEHGFVVYVKVTEVGCPKNWSHFVATDANAKT